MGNLFKSNTKEAKEPIIHKDVKLECGLYTGRLLDGKPHGEGTIVLNDGSTLTGIFLYGVKNGRFIQKSKKFITVRDYEHGIPQRAQITVKNTGFCMNVRFKALSYNQFTIDESNVQIQLDVPLISAKIDPIQLCKYFLNPPALEENRPTTRIQFKGSAVINAGMNIVMLQKGEISIFQTYCIEGQFKDGFFDGNALVYDFNEKKKYNAEFKHAVCIRHYNEELLGIPNSPNQYVAIKNNPNETQDGENEDCGPGGNVNPNETSPNETSPNGTRGYEEGQTY